MPYIKQELRAMLSYELDGINGQISALLSDPKNDRAGLLNYVFTNIIDAQYGPLSAAKYRDYNEAIGMLECCKLEFYRKAAAPYEDLKEKENGAVLDGETRKSLKSPKPAEVKNTPIEMLLTKPSEGFDVILKPGIVNKPSESLDASFRYGFHQPKLEHSQNNILYIFKATLTPGITAFIKAKTFLEAGYILNDILLSPEYESLNYNNIGNSMKLYKSYESLEGEIKNAFISNVRDKLDSNFVIFLKVQEH